MLVCVIFRLHTDDAALHDAHFNYIYVALLLHCTYLVCAGRKIHAGTRHFAVLPLSLAVNPLKCAEGARHDLLPCPDCQNISKWGEKCMSN